VVKEKLKQSSAINGNPVVTRKSVFCAQKQKRESKSKNERPSGGKVVGAKPRNLSSSEKLRQGRSERPKGGGA